LPSNCKIKIHLSIQGSNSFKTKAPTALTEVKIIRCGENAFKYLRSTARAIQNENDPFAEPSPTWNNIKNGYGIFGLYISEVQVFTF